MARRKVLGSYTTELCASCGAQAFHKNDQGVPVCKKHAKEHVVLLCTCGQPFELLDGKWGTYASCAACGSVTLRKAIEKNRVMRG